MNPKPTFRVSGLAVPAIAPGNSYINTIEFLYPWNTTVRATQIPAGERFDLVVNYRCNNTLGSLFDPFSMCIVFWTDELDAIYDINGVNLLGRGYYFRNQAVSNDASLIADNIARIANNYQLKMPAHNVVFKFNMFANDANYPDIQVPDVAQWTLTR